MKIFDIQQAGATSRNVVYLCSELLRKDTDTDQRRCCPNRRRFLPVRIEPRGPEAGI